MDDAAEVRTENRQIRGVGLPVILFIATCYSTYSTGGFAFALALMITLLAHELGHFIQAMRYGVPASLPFFIPMPLSPIGTMGAVIMMAPGRGDRRAIFDIAVTGPLAGLIFALMFSVVGMRLSEIALVSQPTLMRLGEPLLFKGLAYLTFGPLDPTLDIALHPIAYAGWVGIFITALNLIPIGQLDGGHILYALLRQQAHVVAQLFLVGAALGVIV